MNLHFQVYKIKATILMYQETNQIKGDKPMNRMLIGLSDTNRILAGY